MKTPTCAYCRERFGPGPEMDSTLLPGVSGSSNTSTAWAHRRSKRSLASGVTKSCRYSVWHGHRDGERNAERERLLGHELVGAFGQRRHDADAAIRVAMLQLAEEILDSLTDARISAHEVAVPGYRDDQRHGTAACGRDRLVVADRLGLRFRAADRCAAGTIHAGFASVPDAAAVPSLVLDLDDPHRAGLGRVRQVRTTARLAVEALDLDDADATVRCRRRRHGGAADKPGSRRLGGADIAGLHRQRRTMTSFNSGSRRRSASLSTSGRSKSIRAVPSAAICAPSRAHRRNAGIRALRI